MVARIGGRRPSGWPAASASAGQTRRMSFCEGRGEPGAVDGEQRQEIMDVGAVLEGQRAFHIGFAGMQLGVEEQL